MSEAYELNPHADRATRIASFWERRGRSDKAQGYRNMRWGSVARQQRGEPTSLDTDDWDGTRQ